VPVHIHFTFQAHQERGKPAVEGSPSTAMPQC
jgi:hypothetical protein